MKRIVLTFIILVMAAVNLCAQEIYVTGRLTSSVDSSPMVGARIFAFKTVGEGKEQYQIALECFKQGLTYNPDGLVRQFWTIGDGSYDLTVIEKGSILYIADPFEPVFERVNGRDKINVVIQATQMLDESKLMVKRERKTERGTKPTMTGKEVNMTRYYYLNKDKLGEVEGVGKTNSRLVVQAFIMNSDGSDTVHYFKPRVYTGEEFKKTQKYWSDDYLYEVSEKMPNTLTELTDSIHVPVMYEFDDPTVLYFCKANIWIEDYLGTYYQDSLEIFNTGRVSRPFQFLEYSFEQSDVDRERYKRLPKKEKVATPKNMKLRFLVNKAELDRTDRETMAAMDSLKEELRMICSDPYSTLKELHFKGYSSPDGQYAKNDVLSKDRTRTVFNEVFYGLPRWAQEKVYHTDSGFVATWSEVANLMAADSLNKEAGDIRNIVNQHPGNMDKQGAQMKALPYYKSKVSPYLDELRSVKCEHITEVFRELEPHEIFQKYQEDPDLRNGKKFMTLNEYWHLFELVKDEKELERLYIRAKRHAWNTERREWALPNNKLAMLYLKRKQVDTTLLHPFIDEYSPVNSMVTIDLNGTRAFVNDEAIVSNQVQMLMLAKEYDRAEEISSIIADTHPMLRAIVRCIGDFIDYDDPSEQPTIDLIRQSSPRNEVIVNLYMAGSNPVWYDSTTVAALKRLPIDDPLTYYIRAQRLCMKFNDDHIEMKNQVYDRALEDPLFRHPNDEVIPAATPEDIEQQKGNIQVLVEDIELYQSMGLDVSDMEKELAAAKEKLNLMLTGEEKINPCECNVYDAVFEYLYKCFNMDKKYIRTAQADWDVNEIILKDVLKKINEEKNDGINS